MPKGGTVDRSETRDVFGSRSLSLLLRSNDIIASRRECGQFWWGWGIAGAKHLHYLLVCSRTCQERMLRPYRNALRLAHVTHRGVQRGEAPLRLLHPPRVGDQRGLNQPQAGTVQQDAAEGLGVSPNPPLSPPKNGGPRGLKHPCRRTK
jgi:hypothetical protein